MIRWFLCLNTGPWIISDRVGWTSTSFFDVSCRATFGHLTPEGPPWLEPIPLSKDWSDKWYIYIYSYTYTYIYIHIYTHICIYIYIYSSISCSYFMAISPHGRFSLAQRGFIRSHRFSGHHWPNLPGARVLQEKRLQKAEQFSERGLESAKSPGKMWFQMWTKQCLHMSSPSINPDLGTLWWFTVYTVYTVYWCWLRWVVPRTLVRSKHGVRMFQRSSLQICWILVICRISLGWFGGSPW